MRVSEARKIQNRYEELVRDLDLEDTCIIDSLFSEGILTTENKDTLKANKTNLQKNRCFLDILMTKEDNAYRLFFKALGNDQKHLQEMLDLPGAPRRTARKTVGAGDRKGFEEFSPKEVQDWLRPHLEREKIPISILETFEKEDINGKAFIHMTTEELKDVFPQLLFGTRKRLQVIKDDIASDLEPQAYPGSSDPKPALRGMERVRTFGHTPQASEKYRQNRILNVRDGRTASDLLYPVRQFLPCTEDGDRANLYDFIAENVIVFAAACVNDRQNGTIYFGISNADCDQYSYGQIIGLPLETKECDKAIKESFNRHFKSDDAETAIKCLKAIAFVELILEDEEEDNCFVCEVDIEPRADIVGTKMFLVRLKEETQDLYKLNNGLPEKQHLEAVFKFKDEIESLVQRRQQEERHPTASSRHQNLPQLLKNFMCGGGNKIDGSYYPLLATSALGLQTEDPQFEESFKFIWNIDFRCVFDFDATSDQQGLYHHLDCKEEMLFKVKTFEDFSTPLFSEKGATGSKSSLDEVYQDMSESELKTWIFCNGYEATEMKKLGITLWKKERSAGFKEAVRFFRTNIPEQRAVMVILVTSNDDVLIEASQELLLGFQDQWIMIADSQQLADDWIDGLQKRNIDVDHNRCLYNFSFAEVSKAILQLTGIETLTTCTCVIKSSSGIEENIPKKKVQELCDLDIVSAHECVSAAVDINEDQLNKDQENDFYKGNRATWWNFYFPGHVCQRDKLEELRAHTRKLLDGDVSDNEQVGHVVLYHQPGAGGTTLAMNVIWDLHESVNCCLLKRITDSTASQIISLHEFGEGNPDNAKPILVMIDNEEEKIDDLINNIKKECYTKGIERLVCVLLVCIRTMVVPPDHEMKNIFLAQKLSSREKQFFVTKYDELKRKQRENLDNLLGLNIMKEDFNENYIKRTVSKFVDEIRDHKKTVLKYIAILNCYDMSFRAIPVSCFDTLFTQNFGKHNRKGAIQVFQKRLWENNLSPEPLMLFTQNFKLSGRNKCLRITNKMLCKYVLDDLCEKENISQADLMEEFLCSQVFRGNFQDVEFKELIIIVKEIMKKRGMDAAGKKPTKFSPFIQMLYDESKIDIAVKCIGLVFERTNDAFLAQQIARIFICRKMWDKAEHWARIAAEKFQRNSFIWDTVGQVFKCRLEEIRSECEASSMPLNPETAAIAVKFSKCGFEVFQKVEELSKRENMDPPNTSGLFSQMEIVLLLSNILKHLPSLSSSEELQKVFSGGKTLPRDLQIPGLQEHTKWLGSLQEEAFNCFAAVQNLRMMYADDSRFTFAHTRAKFFLGESNIRHFENKLNRVFVESAEGNETGGESVNSRRGKMRLLGGNSLYSVMNRCGQGDSGKNTAFEIFQLASQNLNQTGVSKDSKSDLSMALASAITLISCHDSCIQEKDYNNLLQWSSVLCQKPEVRKPDWEKYINFDPFIFLLAFHWPTLKRNLLESQCGAAELKHMTALLKEAFEKLQSRSNSSGIPRNNNPIFFFTKMPHVHSIISKDRLNTLCGKRGGRKIKICDLLRSRTALQLVERFPGILQKSGKEVKLCVTSGPTQIKAELFIPLFVKESRQILWNKNVYFALGIGLGGPVACDVDKELPSSAQANQASEHTKRIGTQPFSSRNLQEEVDVQIDEVKEKLGSIHKAKAKPSKSAQESKLIQEETQLRDKLRQLQKQRYELKLDMI